MHQSDTKKRRSLAKFFYDRRRSSQNRNTESSTVSSVLVAVSDSAESPEIPFGASYARQSNATESYQQKAYPSTDKKVETKKSSSSVTKLFSHLRRFSKNKIEEQSNERSSTAANLEPEHPPPPSPARVEIDRLSVEEENEENRDHFNVTSNPIRLRDEDEPVKKSFGDRNRRSSLFALASRRLVSGHGKYEIAKIANLQANSDDRTVSGNVLDLARDFQRRLVHQERQKRTMTKVEEIRDIEHLNQMLESCQDEGQRRKIMKRLNDLKSKRRDSTKENLHISGTGVGSGITTSSSNDNSQLDDFGDDLKQDDLSPSVGGIASLSAPSNKQNVVTSLQPTVKLTGLTPQSTTANSRSPAQIKANMLKWCQYKTKEYETLEIKNFSSSWADGRAFCALLHHYYKDAFDFNSLNPKNVRENLELAFRLAEEKAGIAPLLEVDDMLKMYPKPDYKCVYTYVQAMYQKLSLLDQAKT